MGSLCKSILKINSNISEHVALNMDTNKTQNLELLLGATDFAKILRIEDFKHYELHNAVEHKYDWIWTG